MLSPVGMKLEVFSHWQNPIIINKFGDLNDMHSRVSVQPAIKYRQAQASSIKLPIKAKLVFGLLM